MNIPFSKVSLNGNEIGLIKEVLESGWLTSASMVQKLEFAFTEMLGVKHALAVNSCTSALHLALEASGLRAGEKVFVPTMTFTASAEVVRYLGGEIVFLDVDRETGCITPEILENAISKYPDVRYLILVHFGGAAAKVWGSGDGRGISEVCKENNIKIVEDAAHALPTKHCGQLIGSHGNDVCFSFYANKTMTTGEGGMLVTNNTEVYHRAKTMRLHGINRDVWDRFTNKNSSWEYDVVAPGFKYNMPDINAAIGLAQLEALFDNNGKREVCAKHYYNRLNNLDAIDLPNFPEGCWGGVHSWHLFIVLLNDKSKLSRDEVILRLNKAGVGTSVHYKPLHKMTYYKGICNSDPREFPNSESRFSNAISLPIYPDLTESEINYVCDTLHEILGSGI